MELYEKSLIFIRTMMPLHVGTGRALGVVDLPIERDGIGLPFIPASGLKGSVRELFRGDPDESDLFGPRIEEAGQDSHAGAFNILDAYLVSMPVRSLKGVWACASSPFAIKRLNRLADLSGSPEAVNLSQVVDDFGGQNKVAMSKQGFERYTIDGKIILNEEFESDAQLSEGLERISEIICPEEPWRFIVVPDDFFKEIVERSLLRRFRIKLKPETKTVESGALWSEEDVPPNAVFTTASLYSDVRKPRHEGNEVRNADWVKKRIENKLLTEMKGYLNLGGHETVGRGLVKLEARG